MADQPLRRVVLETSLKPFKDLAPDAIEATCLTLLSQWRPLTRCAETAGVLQFVGDGTEIFRWRNRLDEPFDWGKYIGHCSVAWRPYPGDPAGYQVPHEYIADPPEFTYSDLRRIIRTLKRVSQERYGQALFVGAMVDPGPEFLDATFKFVDHPELLVAGPQSEFSKSFTFLDVKRSLRADPREYAGFPDGIPEGTTFGTFLGRQCASFLPAMGYDYIWFSNGLGYSAYAWLWTGENYNGERFGTADWELEAERLLTFWRDFRRECPDIPIEVRGTNYPLGVDLAAHCAPHDRIHQAGDVRIPPVNPPWGSVDMGMELAAYMTRIARLPGEHFAFRAYINDPWFWTNPWWDYYNRQPYDIYTPLSVARVNGRGEVEGPQQIEFLTTDTELGEYQEECALEVIPHVRRAFKMRPDAPGIVTWLYPYDELHQRAPSGAEAQQEAYFTDLFIRCAITAGLPLNTVLSTTDLCGLPSDALGDADAGWATILVAPMPREGDAWAAPLAERMAAGQPAIFYGPATRADPRVLDLLNLRAAEGLAGTLTPQVGPLLSGGSAPEGRVVIHRARLGAGPVDAVLAAPQDPHTTVQATVRAGDEERVYALTRFGDGVRAAWLRGSLPFDIAPYASRPTPDDPATTLDTSRWLTELLAAYGYTLAQERRTASTRYTAMAVARHRGGFILNGFKPDGTVLLWLAWPDGATSTAVPILTEKQALIRNGRGRYGLERWFHEECRVLVAQREGVVGCKEMQHPTGTSRRLEITGLQDARVTIYPYPEAVAAAEVLGAGQVARLADRLVVEGATGALTVTW